MNMKRMRGRNHRPNGGGGGGGGGGFRNQQNGIPLNRNHVFDSSGPEMRVRGTAQQLYDKYQQMARDASSNGDRVTGEAYYQHAEHYFRIISAINQAQGQPNPQPAASRAASGAITSPSSSNNAGQGQERGGISAPRVQRQRAERTADREPAQEQRPQRIVRTKIARTRIGRTIIASRNTASTKTARRSSSAGLSSGPMSPARNMNSSAMSARSGMTAPIATSSASGLSRWWIRGSISVRRWKPSLPLRPLSCPGLASSR